VFICGGLGLYSEITQTKYFFDKTDKVFFYLLHDNGEYSIHPNKPRLLTDSLRKELTSKIDKVKEKSIDIVEISRLNELLGNIIRNPSKDSKEYNQRFQEAQKFAMEAQNFLDKHNIDITQTKFIE
jgi:predicted CoA-binding protein